MRRILLLLGVALTLALSGTAAADTFAVAPPQAGPVVAVSPAAGTIAFSSATATPVSLPTLRGLWQAAGSAYAIPWEVLAAINKVETNFGRNLGPSSAGAVGWMQFLPSTWLRWGVDANGDGVADPNNPADAIFSAARYLAAAGGQTDLRQAIFAYNHADWYVNEVLGLAAIYAQGGGGTLFSLDRLQAEIDAARRQVAATNTQLVAARARARTLGRTERRFLRQAMVAPLISGRLEARKRAVLVGVRRDAVDARVARLQGVLATATGRLGSARGRARGASFASAAGQLLAAPTAAGSYVFPVGGGPGVVSVPSTHHNFPAADIAAPEGAPVYALADALVVHAWSQPNGSCGIGATITTADGQTWTYCHLSYLDPSVHAGASLAAGAPMGLVGQTGDATGPHLHLQLDPTTAYPQDEPWFRAFAGIAFRWQTGDPSRLPLATSTSSHPLFVQLGRPLIPFGSGADGGAIAFSQDVVYFTH